jgi:hypothetical protein
LTLVRMLEPSSRSFSMPLPGLLGSNWLTSTHQIPLWSGRLASCVYCPYPFVWRVCFPMLLSTWCFVVALSV